MGCITQSKGAFNYKGGFGLGHYKIHNKLFDWLHPKLGIEALWKHHLSKYMEWGMKWGANASEYSRIELEIVGGKIVI